MIYLAAGALFFALATRYSDALLLRKKTKIVYSERRMTDAKPRLSCAAEISKAKSMSLDDVARRGLWLTGLDGGYMNNLCDDIEWQLKSLGLAVRECTVCGGNALKSLLTYRIYEKAVLNGSPAVGGIPREVRRSMSYMNRLDSGRNKNLPGRGSGGFGTVYFPSFDSAARFASSLCMPTAESAALLLSNLCGKLVIE